MKKKKTQKSVSRKCLCHVKNHFLFCQQIFHSSVWTGIKLKFQCVRQHEGLLPSFSFNGRGVTTPSPSVASLFDGAAPVAASFPSIARSTARWGCGRAQIEFQTSTPVSPSAGAAFKLRLGSFLKSRRRVTQNIFRAPRLRQTRSAHLLSPQTAPRLRTGTF